MLYSTVQAPTVAQYASEVRELLCCGENIFMYREGKTDESCASAEDKTSVFFAFTTSPARLYVVDKVSGLLLKPAVE